MASPLGCHNPEVSRVGPHDIYLNTQRPDVGGYIVEAMRPFTLERGISRVVVAVIIPQP
jgi:hypothetical protein